MGKFSFRREFATRARGDNWNFARTIGSLPQKSASLNILRNLNSTSSNSKSKFSAERQALRVPRNSSSQYQAAIAELASPLHQRKIPQMGAVLPRKMPALRKLKSEPGLWFVPEIDLPTIGPRDVLVEVTHAGICGTDRHIYEWDAWSRNRVKVGITTGHEFCGIVKQIGPAVTRVAEGTRVSAEGHIGCGKCEQCRTGNGHVCNEVKILGIDTNGCFAGYVIVPEENIWPVHERIANEVAAVFDPLGNAVHTVMTAGVSGKSVLITGVGIIGLMAVSVAKAAGAGAIFATDIDTRRLKLARELGAAETFVATTEWVNQLKTATGGSGPHVLLEMSGNKHAIRDGFAALRNGGTAAMLGIPADDVPFDFTNHVIFKGATVFGINGRRMFETWYQMEELLLSGRLNLEPIITHVIEMKDYERGFKLMQSGEAIKVVMKIPH